MVKSPPQLDPIRLELAAGLYDSVVWQLEVYCDDAQRYCLTVEDAGEVAVCDYTAGFTASMTPPQRPPIPPRLEDIDFDLLAPARDLFEEAHGVHPPVDWR
jgi:hypothetical protein